MSDSAKNKTSIISIKKIKNAFGNQVVHEDLNLDIYPQEIVALVGGSGSGKTVLLRNILMLLQPKQGAIKLLNTDILTCSEKEKLIIKKRCGVAFQKGALFSSLTVLENVMFPLKELTKLSEKTQKELALLKIALSGLPEEAAWKYSSELSGGMQKRAAFARAIALDPEVLFLDEPTAGLDPQSVYELGELILYLRDTLNLTVLLVTHDLDLLHHVPDRVAFLGDKKIIAAEPLEKLMKNEHPLVKKYFSSTKEKERII